MYEKSRKFHIFCYQCIGTRDKQPQISEASHDINSFADIIRVGRPLADWVDLINRKIEEENKKQSDPNSKAEGKKGGVSGELITLSNVMEWAKKSPAMKKAEMEEWIEKELDSWEKAHKIMLSESERKSWLQYAPHWVH